MVAMPIKHRELIVGLKPIDDLHAEFEDVVAALAEATEADYGARLAALHEHLVRHCATEEHFMSLEGYPHLDRHRRQHRRLLESVSSAWRRFEEGDHGGFQQYADDLMRWFAIHASTEDRELAGFLKGEGDDGSCS